MQDAKINNGSLDANSALLEANDPSMLPYLVIKKSVFMKKKLIQLQPSTTSILQCSPCVLLLRFYI